MAITLTLETTGSGSLRVLPHSMLHPGEEYKSALRNSTPLEFWGRANSYTCPLGKEPGSAFILMLRRHLNAFSKNSFHKLVWDDGASTKLTIPSLTMVRSTCINRAISGELDAAHLVELRDKRHMFQSMTSIASQYNVRIPAPDCTASPEIYYNDSLNSSSVWTWQTLVDDIWGNLPTTAGTAPTLPYSPDATPEGWRFIGVSAWDALHEVLRKIDCTTSYNPITDVFSYVQLGTTQSGLATAKVDLANLLLYDYDPGQDHQLADMPEKVRVFFHRRDEYAGIEKDSPEAGNWEMLPYEFKNVSTGITGVLSGSVLPIWDDLPALYDCANTNTNCALLDTRAAEIAANIKNRIDISGERFGRVYSGLRQTILPGSEISEVRWRDFGDDGGLVTEILQRPPKQMPAIATERIAPPDLARASYPVFPRLSQMVQVDDGASANGADLTPSNEMYPGFVRRWADGAWTSLEACYIRPTDLVTAGSPPSEATVATLRQKDSFVGRLSGVGTNAGGAVLPVYLVRLGAEDSGMYDYNITADDGGSVTIDAQDTVNFEASGGTYTTQRNATKSKRGIVHCVAVDGTPTIKNVFTAVDCSVIQCVAVVGDLTNATSIAGEAGTRNSFSLVANTANVSPICLTAITDSVVITPNNPFHCIQDTLAATADLNYKGTLELSSSDGSVDIDVTAGPVVDFTNAGDASHIGEIKMSYKAPIVDTGKNYMDDGSGGAGLGNIGAADTNWALMDGTSNASPGSAIPMCSLSSNLGYFVRGESKARADSTVAVYGRTPRGDTDEINLSIAAHPDHVHIVTNDQCSDTDGDNAACAHATATHNTGIQKTNAPTPLSLTLDHTPVFAPNDAADDDDFEVLPPHQRLWFYERVA